MQGFLKAALATAVYGAVHSLVAAKGMKRAVADRLGRRHRDGLYRPFYIVQSLVTFGALILYIRTLPRKQLYQIDGRAALVMRGGQAAALLWAVLAARSVGILDITGLRNLGVWLTGRDPAPEPEAQGPRLGDDGEMHMTGPFRLSRHPLNLAPFPIFWLQPTMTTRMLGFNVVGTAYLLLGSLHEERRLKGAYGPPYRRYLHSDVPFYLPHRQPLPRR